MNDRYGFTINEFCEWSRIGRTKTYEMIGNGSLPIIKVGKKTIIRADGAKALLDSLVSGAADTAKPTSEEKAA